jgi:hypothetical protein
MKRLLLSLSFIISTLTWSLKGECEECKQMRAALKTAWEMNITFSKTLKDLTTANISHGDKISRMQSGG